MSPQDSLPDPIDEIILDQIYAPPSEKIQKAVTHELLDFHRAYLRVAPFFCLASGSARGLDASPRGGSPGFVRVLDQRTVAFADWPGNNRIESLRNMQQDDRVGLLFLFPGLDIFMRINGRARISLAPDLLADLAEGQRRPKCAIIVAIDEVLFHCGKSINRARLWDPTARIDRNALPSIGTMLLELAKDAKELHGFSPAALDALYNENIKKDLY